MDIKPEEYKFLTKREDLHWFCSECEPAVKAALGQSRDEKEETTLNKIIQEMEKMKITLTEKLENLESKVKNNTLNEQRIEDIVQKQLSLKSTHEEAVGVESNESLKTCPSCIPSTSFEADESQEQKKPNKEKAGRPDTTKYAEAARTKPTTQEVNAQNGEIKAETENIAEILKRVLGESTIQIPNTKADMATTKGTPAADREKNIIIHRVQESSERSIEDKKKHDDKFFHSLCKVLDVAVEPDRIFRLGPPKEGTNRPLKVILDSTDEKFEFMTSLYKLKTAAEPYRGLSITDDMNQQERIENRRLVKEAKEMTESDDSGHIYKVRGPPWNRHIVKLKPQ